MSLHDYEVARELERRDVPFYGLIMAAMWRADSENAARLRAAWPEVWEELQARYNTPGATLPGDPLSAA